jgi:hypothetical protein
MRTTNPIGAAALALVLAAGTALAGSETPPKGPPWLRDFKAAQTEALETGKAIFVYLTKTH